MPYTTPKTWVTEEIVTSTNLNTHLRDNVAWLASDHPRCHGHRTATQTITTATDTAITFNAADAFDVGNMHDPSVNATRFTVPSGGDGLYRIEAFGEWAAGGTGSRQLKLRKNGSSVFWEVNDPVASATLPMVQNIAGSEQLVATDYVELLVLHGQGTNLLFSNVHLVIQWVAT